MSIIDVRDDILALDFEYDISIVLACQNILYVTDYLLKLLTIIHFINNIFFHKI